MAFLGCNTLLKKSKSTFWALSIRQTSEKKSSFQWNLIHPVPACLFAWTPQTIPLVSSSECPLNSHDWWVLVSQGRNKHRNINTHAHTHKKKYLGWFMLIYWCKGLCSGPSLCYWSIIFILHILGTNKTPGGDPFNLSLSPPVTGELEHQQADVRGFRWHPCGMKPPLSDRNQGEQ